MTKLLIDECLSPTLVHMARSRGHHQSTHVVWLGKASSKDWDLMRTLLEDDWIFVTKNNEDFRGPRDAPGTKGQYAGVMLHAGLICINGPVGMDRTLQSILFDAALDDLEKNGDLTNQVLEIHRTEDELSTKSYRYDLPKQTH